MEPQAPEPFPRSELAWVVVGSVLFELAVFLRHRLQSPLSQLGVMVIGSGAFFYFNAPVLRWFFRRTISPRLRTTVRAGYDGPMNEYRVDVSDVKSWPEFVAAFNRDFIRPTCDDEWGGSLYALHNYLSWPNDPRYRLVVLGWSGCATAISSHKAPDGRPIMVVVEEIFRDNPHANVVLA